MKKTGSQYLIGLFIAIHVLNINAQDTTELARSADTIFYYIINPHGNNAEITWTITGGIIIGHSSPYTEDGADTIRVIWNDSNKTNANYGSLKVSYIVNWAIGSSCESPEEQINVESWVRPKAIVNTSSLSICSGDTFKIRVNFEGKPGYKFKWKLFDRDNPAKIIEDHTETFITCNDSLTDILITGIDNNTGTEQVYDFEITDVNDGLTDGTPGDVSTAKASIYVQPKALPGILKDDNHLIRR